MVMNHFSIGLYRSFSLSDVTIGSDIIGVLHAGILKKSIKKLRLDARIKMCSSSLNIETTNNSGTLTTISNHLNILLRRCTT